MRIAHVADIHAGNHRRYGGTTEAGLNARCRQIVDVLERAVSRARELRCHAFYVAGDLVDTVRPEPQVLAALQQVFQEAGMPVTILLGNHDQVSEQQGDHALGPFAPVAAVVDTAAWSYVGSRNDGLSAAVLCVPFQPGDAREWLPKVVAELCATMPKCNRTLLLHLGLASTDTAAYLQDAHDAVPGALVVALCKKYGFQAAFAGNWHNHKVLSKDPMVCQIGALVPTGWDNPGMTNYGSLAIWDTDTRQLTYEEIPGPRFIDANDLTKLPPAKGCSLYVRTTVGSDQMARALEQAEQARTAGMVQAVEVTPDLVQARAATRTAATVARSAATLDEALSGYVDQMSIPDGVLRAEVLANAKRYLAGS